MATSTTEFSTVLAICVIPLKRGRVYRENAWRFLSTLDSPTGKIPSFYRKLQLNNLVLYCISAVSKESRVS